MRFKCILITITNYLPILYIPKRDIAISLRDVRLKGSLNKYNKNGGRKMKFAERLRQLIEDSNISQKQLAHEIKMSPSTLANYVQGSRSPDFDTLIAIARYFNVTTDYLLGSKQDNADEHLESKLLQVFRSLSREQQDIYIEQGKAFVRTTKKKKEKK